MDWDRVIERNGQALKRIVAALVAMAGLGDGSFTFPLWGSEGRARQVARPESEASGGRADLADTPTRRSGDCRPPHKGEVNPVRPTLPRHLHSAVLRLLRPAEAAARRLVVVVARGLATPPSPRPREATPDPKVGQKPGHAVLRGLGIAVVLSPAEIAATAGGRGRAAPRRARPLLLPLLDPLRRSGVHRRTVPPHAAPRILSFDGAVPHRLPSPPSPDDAIDATRLSLRLAALAEALEDLPGQARRLARWKASRDAAGAQYRESDRPPLRSGEGEPAKAVEGDRNQAVRRLSPLRLGRACGSRGPCSRRPVHEVDAVLADLHHFALRALHPDTS